MRIGTPVSWVKYKCSFSLVLCSLPPTVFLIWWIIHYKTGGGSWCLGGLSFYYWFKYFLERNQIDATNRLLSRQVTQGAAEKKILPAPHRLPHSNASSVSAIDQKCSQDLYWKVSMVKKNDLIILQIFVLGVRKRLIKSTWNEPLCAILCSEPQ